MVLSLSVEFVIAFLSFVKIAQLTLTLFISLLCVCSSSSSLDHECLLFVMCVNNCKYSLKWSLSSLLFCLLAISFYLTQPVWTSCGKYKSSTTLGIKLTRTALGKNSLRANNSFKGNIILFVKGSMLSFVFSWWFLKVVLNSLPQFGRKLNLDMLITIRW